VQISSPLVLAQRLVDNPEGAPSSPGALPDAVAARFGAFAPGVPRRALYATLGLFAVTQLSRRVQVFVPSFDFGLEGNTCSATSETPAELFARVPFPLEAFSPPQVPDSGPLFSAENFREDDIANLPSINGDFSQGQQTK
jgi:hypothetical protein